MLTDKSGLPSSTIEAIQTALARFPAISYAVLYGSRAKGTYRPGSDIDLTLHTTADSPENLLLKVVTALDELNIPYSFDVSLYHQIDNAALKEHIQRVGIELYNAASYHTAAQQSESTRRYLEEQHQSEAQLEAKLVKQLTGLGYQQVSITNADELRYNLKRQLEIHNKIELSHGEFNKIVNHLDKGNVFVRAKTLRDRFLLNRDDGSSCYIQFFNSLHWCQNQYQVTHQITQQGKYQNRYDVTLLINGLPLVQIELKRRGIELQEAFNQINRYQRHSFWSESGLFNYVQLFVISNGVNTKYYANNRKQDFKQTFFWADFDNNLITELTLFADAFLEKCHLSKMISKYIVLHESDKLLMVLRPYQYYAVEAIEKRVKEGRKNGYVWHTTGSGKTLTSFKAAQILTELPKVDKVIFAVDRADLDYQTTREFNQYSEGSVDGTSDTAALVKQMAGNIKLIVTTIQKLNSAIKSNKYEKAMAALRDKRVVFIFDECHRSQFGETHKSIIGFFTHAQLFGFTGTPIKKDNAVSVQGIKRTTEDLFTELLHKYLINNAIADHNVLKFAVEYWGKPVANESATSDEQVSSIDTQAYFLDEHHIAKNVDWIIAHHDRKTHNRQFSSMLCVSSKEMLFKYYDIFKQKQLDGKHDLRVVTIFTYAANESDEEANGLIGEPDFDIKTDESKYADSREKLEQYVADYNALYQTQHSVKDSKAFYSYYKDIAKRMKEREKENFQDKDRADILLVVNMFLTGFDAKKLNTLYVDKNLKHHGLIQAFSRTNRVLGELKSQGNIVCFRNLKQNTDDAIALFSDPNSSEKVLLEPYEHYAAEFNLAVDKLQVVAASPDQVNALQSESEKLEFVKLFRQLIRTLNKLKSFTEFNWTDLQLTQQEFEDYKSKYLDIYDFAHKKEAGASILEEVDFELELIHRDEVNVDYILNLLSQLQKQQAKSGTSASNDSAKQQVLNLLAKETQLRSKRELIEKFIADYMPKLSPQQDLRDIFTGFWQREKRFAIHQLCEREMLDKEAVYQLLDEYSFTGKEPLREQVFATLNYRPKLLERKQIYERILHDLKDIIQRFEDHTGVYESGEEPGEYEFITHYVHRLGDYELFFADEIKKSRYAHQLARFSIVLDKPYQDGLPSLAAYPVASKLLGHGIASDAMFDDYLHLTAEFQQTLSQYGFEFDRTENFKDGTVFWALAEAREGSLILEFALFIWVSSKAVKTVMEFLKDYKDAAEGLDRLKYDIKSRFVVKTEDAEKQPSMIIVEGIEEELRKLRNSRH
jgi:type I restriction enzyme, R subunit